MKGITWKYYLFSFFSGLSLYTAALIPFYTNWGHISLTQVQFLQAWLMFWAFILEIPTGVVADKFGRKYSVVLGTLATFLSFLVYGLFANYATFLLAEFLAALGLALISGAGEALLYDSLKEEGKEGNFKNVFGKAFSIGQISAIISAPLGGLIASKMGLNIPMLASAIPVLIAAVIISSAKEPMNKMENKEEKKYLDIAKKGIASFLRNRSLRLFAFNGILVYTSAYFLIWLYQPQLTELGVPIVYFGLIRSLFALSGMVFTQNLLWTEKLFKTSANFFKLTALISLTSLTLVALFPSLAVVIMAIILIGGLGQARFTALNSYMNDLIPSAERATALSTISMLNRIVLIVLNPAVGYIADQSLSVAFLSVAGLLLATFVLIPLPLSEQKLKEA